MNKIDLIIKDIDWKYI